MKWMSNRATCTYTACLMGDFPPFPLWKGPSRVTGWADCRAALQFGGASLRSYVVLHVVLAFWVWSGLLAALCGRGNGQRVAVRRMRPHRPHRPHCYPHRTNGRGDDSGSCQGAGSWWGPENYQVKTPGPRSSSPGAAFRGLRWIPNTGFLPFAGWFDAVNGMGWDGIMCTLYLVGNGMCDMGHGMVFV